MGVGIGRPNRSDIIQNNMALKYVVSLKTFFFVYEGKREILIDWLHENIGYSNKKEIEVRGSSNNISAYEVLGEGWKFESHMIKHTPDIVEPGYDMNFYHKIELNSYNVFIKTIVTFENEQDAVWTKLILDNLTRE